MFYQINKGNNILRVGITPTETLSIDNRHRKQGGVDKFSPHDLRRSLIGDMVDMDIDMVEISRLVCHSSINAAVGMTADGTPGCVTLFGNISVSRCILKLLIL